MADIFNVSEADLDSLAEIEKKCIPDPWSINSFRAEFAAKGSVFLAARQDGVICGFVTASTVLDEVCISNVAVLPEYRRKGIAKALLDALYERVKPNASFITLEVRESNLGAIALYSELGYKNVGMRKNFYSAPTENAILMTLTF